METMRSKHFDVGMTGRSGSVIDISNNTMGDID